ncbi:MAG: hypothetical protein ACW98D_18020 [Promethearchaeota archaeon]|jgi:hypothetical protein
METKEKVIDNYILENEVKNESKSKKRSFIKFIHVFESDVNISPIKKKFKRNYSKHSSYRDQRRLQKKWNESLSHYRLYSQKFTFGLNN